MCLTKLIVAIVFCASAASAGTTGFQPDTPSCSGEFHLKNFTYDCGGGDCIFGSDMNVTGVLTSASGFNRSQSLEIIGCLSGMKWTCSVIYEVEAINLCSELVAIDRMACGSAGDYAFDFSFNLPGKLGQNWLWGYSLHVEAIFADGDGSETTCKTAIHTFQSTTAWSLVGILLVATAATYGWKRRKAAATTVADEGIEFKMMSDTP